MFFGDADKVLVVKTVVREVMLVLVVTLQRALQEAMQVPSFQRLCTLQSSEQKL